MCLSRLVLLCDAIYSANNAVASKTNNIMTINNNIHGYPYLPFWKENSFLSINPTEEIP